MKKIFSIILVLTMVLAFTACGQKRVYKKVGPAPTVSENTSEAESVSESETESASEEVTEPTTETTTATATETATRRSNNNRLPSTTAPRQNRPTASSQNTNPITTHSDAATSPETQPSVTQAITEPATEPSVTIPAPIPEEAE